MATLGLWGTKAKATCNYVMKLKVSTLYKHFYFHSLLPCNRVWWLKHVEKHWPDGNPMVQVHGISNWAWKSKNRRILSHVFIKKVFLHVLLKNINAIKVWIYTCVCYFRKIYLISSQTLVEISQDWLTGKYFNHYL